MLAKCRGKSASQTHSELQFPYDLLVFLILQFHQEIQTSLQRVLTPDCSFSSRVCRTCLTMSKGVFPGGDFPGPRSRQGLTSQCQDSRKIVEDYLWEGVAYIYVDLSASMQCWTCRSLPIPIQNPDCPTCTFFSRRFISTVVWFLQSGGGFDNLMSRIALFWWPEPSSTYGS